MSWRIGTIAAATVTFSTTAARAQGLPEQLAPATRDTIQRLADSARSVHLPSELLLAKAAEGALKGADDARIVRAVRQLTRELGTAASLLPQRSSSGALSAAASALHSGASPATLERLVRAKSSEADLTVALVTLADLMASHVPADLAASSVEHLMQRHATEAEMAAFRSTVSRQLAGGVQPRAAVDAGVRDALPRVIKPNH